MRAPLQWLADYVDLELPTEDLGHRLTMAGLKIESIERIGENWRDVIVGQVIALDPHPTSRNPLNVARVEVDGRTITVVTGAQNVRMGDKVAVVPVGGLLPYGPEGQPIVIERRPMAGITSEGMLASERELGISEEHSGIYILPPEAPAGMPLRSFMGGDVLDIETTPNRPDTLSMLGIAREVAALTEQQLMPSDPSQLTGQIELLDEESIPVRIEAPDLCPRYSALRIEGVEVTPSPSWMANRLQAAGMRPINLVVDITNYVMLEYGQPMHAFDASRLAGGQIVVRRATDGEHLRTLDGADRSLTPDNLVIADGERAVAIAGVMGGEESEITEGTTAIVLESATFNPVSVRRTAQRFALRTEASSRFEKGLPVEQTVPAAQRFLQLLLQISGRPLRAARISDAWVGKPEPRTVVMPLRDLHRLIGLSIPPERAAEVLSLLGFDVALRDDALSVVVPYWRRVDIEQSADLVEEVARMVGYDAVPSTLPRRTMRPTAPLPNLHWQDAVRQRLLAGGASEAVTHGLTSMSTMARLARPDSVEPGEGGELWANLVPNPAGVYAREALIEPVRIMNPASRDRDVLRLTLLPSLLEVVARNLKHTEERIAFFDIDHTFFARPAKLPYERQTLGLALSGKRYPVTWQVQNPEPYSFYDLKGMLEAVLESLQIRDWRVEAAAHPALHPGRSARLRLDAADVAYFGELHPDVAAAFDIEGYPVQVAEMDLDTIFEHATDTRVFHPLPRHPSAYRDIAAVVDDDVPASAVLSVIRAAGDDLLESATIFDVYAGPPLPSNVKSVAVALQFRAPGATLTQDEVQAMMDRIVEALARELHASLRE